MHTFRAPDCGRAGSGRRPARRVARDTRANSSAIWDKALRLGRELQQTIRERSEQVISAASAFPFPASTSTSGATVTDTTTTTSATVAVPVEEQTEQQLLQQAPGAQAREEAQGTVGREGNEVGPGGGDVADSGGGEERRGGWRAGLSAAAGGAAVGGSGQGRGRSQDAAAGAGEGPGAAGGGGPPGDGSVLQVEVRVVDSISRVPQAEWDALACSSGGGEVNPFLLWAFLHALEESGSAAPRAGWQAQHLVARDPSSGRLLGAVPLYLKAHSYGEYVFDSAWAQAADMMGVRYYPKLQAAVPFTPVTGPRLLVSGALAGGSRRAVVRALGRALVSLADSSGLSGVHVTFCGAEEWGVLAELGFQQRLGIQFHWDNPGYGSFEDFLADLRQSKRKSIRQERKSIPKAGLAVHRLRGEALRPAHWDRFYEFYLSTVDRKWGNAYLTRDFFHRLGEQLPDRVLLVAATEAEHAPSPSSPSPSAPPACSLVAGALNLVGSHALYGRNWGCAEGREVRHLHFELCYYQALEEAISRGLPRVEAGAQGEHKLQRGYLPAFTYSCHYLSDPSLSGAVQRFLGRERAQVEYTMQLMSLEASPYRAQRTASALVARLQAHASASSTDSTDSMDADEGGRRGSSSREPDSTSVRVSSRSGSSPDAAADE